MLYYTSLNANSFPPHLQLSEEQIRLLITHYEQNFNKGSDPDQLDREEPLALEELIFSQPTSFFTVSKLSIFSGQKPKPEPSFNEAYISSSFIQDKEVNVFGRADKPFLQKSFVALFERARNAPVGETDPIDFDLFALDRSLEKNDGTLLPLLFNLHIVRQHPDWFKDIKADYNDVNGTSSEIEKVIKKYAKELDLKTPKAKIPLPAGEVRTRKSEMEQVRPFPFVSSKAAKSAQNRPFEGIYSHFFSTKETLPSPSPFILEIPGGEDALAPIQQQILNNLKEGHAINNKKPHTEYTLRNNDIPGLKKAIEEQLEMDNDVLTQLKSELKILGNRAPFTPEGDLHRLNVQSGKLPRITLEDPLLEAFMNQDMSEILRRNPFLKPHDIEPLLELVQEYLIISSRKDQAQNALQMMEGLSEDKIDPEGSRN